MIFVPFLILLLESLETKQHPVFTLQDLLTSVSKSYFLLSLFCYFALFSSSRPEFLSHFKNDFFGVPLKQYSWSSRDSQEVLQSHTQPLRLWIRNRRPFLQADSHNTLFLYLYANPWQPSKTDPDGFWASCNSLNLSNFVYLLCISLL